MPLPILVPMVVAGIAGIALLAHLLGLSRALALLSSGQARAAWDREIPDDPAWAATLSADGHAALVDTGSGHGLVWVMGADTTARPLAGASVVPSPGGLVIRFPDFAAPVVAVTLDDSSDIEAWRALLKATPETLNA